MAAPERDRDAIAPGDAAVSPATPVPPGSDRADATSAQLEAEVRQELAAPAPGRVAIAGYEVLGLLGRGGMGVVYKAVQVRLKREVALKVVSALQSGSDHLARFRREAETVARLQHPNIVQVFEVGEQEGVGFLSMELMAGGTLAERLKGGPLAARQAAQLVATLASAVHAAHQRGVLHRDLKPANVLLAADGTPKVSDFGVAKLLDDREDQTATGTIVGTAGYMAPEQAAGRTRDVGTPADVYALGAILYETLTGRPPFKGATIVDTLTQVQQHPPVPPLRLQPGLPRDLQTVCLKCLEKEPRRRYGSAEALAEDLRRFLDGEPILARPVGSVERAWKWARRHPAIAALSAVSLLTAGAGFLGVTWKWREAEQQKRLAQAARGDLESTLYFSRVALAYREWQGNNLAQAEQLLAACPAELRGWEWRFLTRLARGEAGQRGHTRSVEGLAFAPSGDLLATASDDRTIKLWDLATGTLVRTLSGHASYVKSVAFSRDGRLLASASWDLTAGVWDPVTARALHVLGGHTEDVVAVALSPDGRTLASASKDRLVKLWDPATGTEIRSLRGHEGALTGVAFAPGGARLASSGDDGSVRLWEVATGRELLVVRGHAGPVTGVAISPSGETLASSGEDGSVRTWDARTGHESRVLRGHERPVTSVAFSVDGRLLASGGEDQTVRVWDAASGRELRALFGHSGPVTAVGFGPDGRLASASGAFQGGEVKLWDPRSGRPLLTLGGRSAEEGPVLRGHAGLVTAVAFSPDGRTLASAAEDRSVRLWDRGTGRELRRIGGQAEIVRAVAFSPDGLQLATSGEGMTPRVWDVASGRERIALAGHAGTIRGVAFSPDGLRLASAGDDQVRVFDVATGRTLWAHAGPASSVAFTTDGRRLFAGGHLAEGKLGIVTVFDEGGRQVQLFRGDAGVIHALALTRDGSRLVAGAEGGAAQVWDVASGRELARLGGHANHVHAAVFSPDGERLVTAGCLDGTLRVWDTGGRVALNLRGHAKGVFALAFSPDGHVLASAGEDKTIRLWDATPVAGPAPGHSRAAGREVS